MTRSRSLTRRHILKTSVAAALIAARTSPGQFTGDRWLLIGGSRGQGIYRARWQPLTGEIGPVELAVATPQPTWLTRHPSLPIVYACNEGDTLATSTVSAFRLDSSTASLDPLGSQSSQGIAPCHASVDRTGHVLLAANYGGGTLAAFPVDSKGALQPVADLFHCTERTCGAPGPVPDRQAAPHLHCATLSPDNRFVLVCDLGDDAILIFPLHGQSRIPLGKPSRIPMVPGAGPRHLAFHPTAPWLYCISELNCTLTLFRWQTRDGTPEVAAVPAATRPLRAADDRTSTGAEVAVSRDGRFLYTSTRGANVLTAFAIDPHKGSPTQVQQIASGGQIPRFFHLDPTGRWLLACNQDSGTITVFAREEATGHLILHAQVPVTDPQCLLFV